MDKRYGRNQIIAALLLLACVGVVFGLQSLVRRLDPFEARTLDPSEWATADPEGRAEMARDAIRRLPAGSAEFEVEVLLGKESVQELPLHVTHPRGTVRTYQYYLGAWPRRYYDSTFLWVHIGADGRVIEAVIGGG